MDSATANLIEILRERVSSQLDSGNLPEAYHASNAALNTAQKALDDDPDNVDAYVGCLDLRAGVLLTMGKSEEARDDYKEALDFWEQRPDKLAELGQIHSSLGASWDADGDDQMAAEHWLKAIDYFERHDPPLLIDIAAVANNLGFLHRHAGDLEQAETHFLRALEIAHSQLGPVHEQTATISSNLGALYHASNYHEQAREMHMMALESRRSLLGEGHPDTAQSHNNLALAMLETGDRSWARRHFEKALAAFEELGPDYAEDLDAVAENYCAFLRSEGEEHLARVIAGRVSEVLAS